MDGGGGRRNETTAATAPSKFSVYQNPALSAALTTTSLRPTASTLLFISSASSASAALLLASILRENGIIDSLKIGYVPQEAAYLFAKAIQAFMAIVLAGTVVALIRAILLLKEKNAASSAKGTKEQVRLTNRQLGLMGIRSNVGKVVSDSSKEPPKPKVNSSPNRLVPIHPPITSSNRSARISSDKSNSGSGTKVASFSTPSKPPTSPYLVPSGTSQSPSMQASQGLDHLVSTPWSSKRGSSTRDILTEEQLEQFLADVDEKFCDSASKMATPPPMVSGFGITSPNTITASGNSSGTTRSTPLRPVRMSPGSQKFNTPPKKGEGDFPPPMSMEETVEAFERLGVYPQIEQWRDRLRQWFSSFVLNPLVTKIETSHTKVIEAAAKLGITVTISQVGLDTSVGATAPVASDERSDEWKPAYTLDEEGVLVQLRSALVQNLNASTSSSSLGSLQQSSAHTLLQECVDAITEHQKLCALVKGEWAKALLPTGSIRAEYVVQRVRELAEGTCVKNYEYLGTGEGFGKQDKKWTELPTDSHLLLYLFCAFLEHPKWMLHVDPSSHVGVQSSKNPLFLGVLPPKERFPEKYVAVISGVPSVLHPGACILAVGKQSPPIFALYWDKKPQFSLRGRTALWDSILLLCHKIEVDYGGIVRGMHLASSALSILPVLDSLDEE